MKFKMTFMYFFILLLFSCNRSGSKNLPFYNTISDIENNDSFKSANIVNSQSPIIGYFNKKEDRDKDFYKVNFAQKNTSYKILLSAVPGIDSKITFFDNSGRIAFILDEFKKGEAEKLWGYYPKGDSVILEIESKVGHNSKVPYLINFVPASKDSIGEIEPNNSKDTASLIRIDDTKKGLISPRDDVDWYNLTITTNKIFDFSIKVETLSNLDINFSITNTKTSKTKFVNAYSWGGEEYFPYLSSDKGKYKIRISANIKPYDRKDPVYYLQIKTLPTTKNNEPIYYEREFNDTIELATDIINSTDTLGTFYPNKDEDWFKFELFKKPISVDISLSPINGVNSIIEIYNKNKKILYTINNHGKNEGESISLNKMLRGKYYIKLYSDNLSATRYKLFLNARYNK